MRWAAWLVLASACNGVLGLHEARLVDATPLEAPPPPPMCPTSGPLMFSHHISQVDAQSCIEYTVAVDAGRALALCQQSMGSTVLPQVFEGPVDDMLAQAHDFDALTSVNIVRIDPDGLGALVRGSSEVAVTDRRYRRTSVGAQWQVVRDVSELIAYSSYTTPTRGPNAHVIAFDQQSATELEEDSAGMWTAVAKTLFSDLGVPPMTSEPALTADGMRMLAGLVVPGPAGPIRHVYYFERDALGGAWNPVQDTPSLVDFMSSSDTLMPTTIGYMTPDCGRFYFSALFSIFYVQQ